MVYRLRLTLPKPWADIAAVTSSSSMIQAEPFGLNHNRLELVRDHSPGPPMPQTNARCANKHTSPGEQDHTLVSPHPIPIALDSVMQQCRTDWPGQDIAESLKKDKDAKGC